MIFKSFTKNPDIFEDFKTKGKLFLLKISMKFRKQERAKKQTKFSIFQNNLCNRGDSRKWHQSEITGDKKLFSKT